MDPVLRKLDVGKSEKSNIGDLEQNIDFLDRWTAKKNPN
jgi:hypothetical protein